MGVHASNSLGRQLGSCAGRYAAPHSPTSGIARRPARERLAWLSDNRPAEQRVGGDQRSLRRSRLEAVLFLAREPLAVRKLAKLANLADGTEARTLVEELQRLYDKRGAAFQVAQVAGGYQLMSRPEYAAWLRKFMPEEQEIRLSAPALETLAVVAYRQPVMRAEVEVVRGVGCGEILRQLMERDLLRIVGRSEELGRPLWYGTTRRFLQAFGLCNLDELPFAAQLRRTAPPALIEDRNSGVSSAIDERNEDEIPDVEAA